MTLTPEQLEMRRKGVFASDMPRIARLLPATWERTSWASLWEEKLGLVPAWEGNAKTKRGALVEPLIAQTWSEATGRAITRNAVSVLHPEIKIIGATADYLTEEGEPIEVKNVGTFMAKKWSNGVPDYVEVQVQTQLAVLGQTRGHVAAWLESSPNLVDVYTVEFKPQIWEQLVVLAQKFWEHVTTNTRPES